MSISIDTMVATNWPIGVTGSFAKEARQNMIGMKKAGRTQWWQWLQPIGACPDFKGLALGKLFLQVSSTRFPLILWLVPSQGCPYWSQGIRIRTDIRKAPLGSHCPHGPVRPVSVRGERPGGASGGSVRGERTSHGTNPKA